MFVAHNPNPPPLCVLHTLCCSETTSAYRLNTLVLDLGYLGVWRDFHCAFLAQEPTEAAAEVGKSGFRDAGWTQVPHPADVEHEAVAFLRRGHDQFARAITLDHPEGDPSDRHADAGPQVEHPRRPGTHHGAQAAGKTLDRQEIADHEGADIEADAPLGRQRAEHRGHE